MEKPQNGINLQLFWGIALILAGMGVFYRIPQVMPEIAKVSHFSGSIWIIRICFYIMGIILIGGGIRKVWSHLKQKFSNHSQNQTTGLGK